MSSNNSHFLVHRKLSNFHGGHNDLVIFSIVNDILLPTVRKNCSIDQEKLLKFKAEGQEFAKILRSLEQFIQTVKGQNNFW